MKANELMIGDIVIVNNTPLKIAALGTKKAGFIDAKGEMFYHDYENLKPMRPTIELIEKNGFCLTVYTENADIRHKSYSYIEDDGLKVAIIVFSDEQIDLFATTPEKTLCIDVLRDMQDLQHTLKLCGIKKEIEL
jgi:hypothetical protein